MSSDATGRRIGILRRKRPVRRFKGYSGKPARFTDLGSDSNVSVGYRGNGNVILNSGTVATIASYTGAAGAGNSPL
jgi:hypothetical protein